MVASAIGTQAANAIDAFATVEDVPEDVQKHRRDRLAALLQHADFGGNQVSLGKALGYASGAYIRQLIAGERSVSEKTIAKIESIYGGRFKGWFAGPAAENAGQEPVNTSTQGVVSMPRDWMSRELQSELDDLTPIELVAVQGATMEAVLRIKAMRKSTGTITQNASVGNAKRA